MVSSNLVLTSLSISKTSFPLKGKLNLLKQALLLNFEENLIFFFIEGYGLKDKKVKESHSFKVKCSIPF